MPKKAVSFEEGLARLESIADEMEKGELPLEKLMKLYDEGIKLSGELEQKLADAQNRMQEVKPGPDCAPVCTEADIVRQESLLDGLE